MKNIRVLKMLRMLSKSQLTRLSKLLKSSFFNNKPALSNILDYLRRFYPDFSEEKIFKENLYSYSYPDSKFDNHLLNKHLSDLGKKMEAFIVNISLEKDPIQYYTCLATFFNHNQEDELFQLSLQHLKKNINQKLIDPDYYYHKFILNRLQYAHHTTEKTTVNLESLKQMYLNLELNYISFRLKYVVECQFRSGILDEELSIDFISEILEKANSYANESYPLIHLYHQLTQLLNSKGELEEFKALRQLYEIYIIRLTLIEGEAFLRYLISFCIRKYHANDTNFLAEQLDLFSWGIKQKVFTLDGYLSESVFLNAVLTAAVARQTKIARQFIKSNEQFLDPKKQKSSIALGKAYCYFNEEKFPKAIQQLEKVDDRSYIYAIRKQSLLLRSYYKEFQLDKIDYSILDKRMVAYERFFNRNTRHLPKDRVKAYLNLLWYIRRMLDYLIDPNQDSGGHLKLLAELPSRPPATKEWVIKELKVLG